MQTANLDHLMQLKEKIAHTEILFNQSRQYPPGDKFQELHNKYIQSCEACVDWISDRYYSVPGFIDFMKRDIEVRAEAHGIAAGDYLAWGDRPSHQPRGEEAAEAVRMLDNIVNYLYPCAENHLNRHIMHLRTSQADLPAPGPW